MTVLTDAEIAQQILDDLSGEFASYSLLQVEPYVTEARLSINCAFWGELYNLASKLLAMHIIADTVAGSSGSAGPVSSKSAGELSITYATPSSSAYTGLYSSTGWGRRFAELLATIKYRATTVI